MSEQERPELLCPFMWALSLVVVAKIPSIAGKDSAIESMVKCKMEKCAMWRGLSSAEYERQSERDLAEIRRDIEYDLPLAKMGYCGLAGKQ